MTVGIGALTFLTSAAAREAIATSRNRVALTQASWTAQACVADLRAVLSDSLLAQAPTVGGSALGVWNRADRIVGARSGEASPCELTLRAVGSRVDVNTANPQTLARLLHGIGLSQGKADSATTALTAQRPFVNARQIRLVRGLDHAPARLDSVLDVEPGAIALNQAPPEVLALLPGVTPEAIDAILEVRRRGASINTFHELSEMLSPSARAAFDGAFPQLVSVVLLAPTAWIVTARSSTGVPAVTAVVEVRLARGGSGTAVVRRRSWVE
jgi:DNA uptake protein ComE-like DNA-binding protein